MLKKEVKRLKSKKYQDENMQKRLRKSYSSAQVQRTLHPTKQFVKNYSKKDVINALILKSISGKAFEFVRSKNVMALPSRQTQERFLKNFKCEPGLLTDGISILEKKLQSSDSIHEKFASLCFDEMNIQKGFEYCPRLRKVYGSHKKIQVAQVRGLTHAWKQPVYANFDKTMNKELLFSLIQALENKGVWIWAIVFDMGNTQLIKELELSPNCFSFPNPQYPDRQIFAFPDVPHLLKLIRNHLLDDGYNFLVSPCTSVSCTQQPAQAAVPPPGPDYIGAHQPGVVPYIQQPAPAAVPPPGPVYVHPGHAATVPYIQQPAPAAVPPPGPVYVHPGRAATVPYIQQPAVAAVPPPGPVYVHTGHAVTVPYIQQPTPAAVPPPGPGSVYPSQVKRQQNESKAKLTYN